MNGFIDTGFSRVDYEGANGPIDVNVQGPANFQDGWLKGLEIAHQQVYDFLPGRAQRSGDAVYLYLYRRRRLFEPEPFGLRSIVHHDRLRISLAAAPLSRSNRWPEFPSTRVNATIFYEKGPLSMRAAYNWRSEFLITPRDDIFPFSPIWQEATGQLDASIFYSVTDQLKIGIQGVNLLDEIYRDKPGGGFRRYADNPLGVPQ